MKKLRYAILGTALLSACAGPSDGAFNTTVTSLESLYLAGAAAAQVYETMPNADPAIVARIKAAESIAFNALQPLVAAAQSGATPDTVAVAAAQAAVSALQAALPATTATGALPVTPVSPTPATPGTASASANTTAAPAPNLLPGAVK